MRSTAEDQHLASWWDSLTSAAGNVANFAVKEAAPLYLRYEQVTHAPAPAPAPSPVAVPVSYPSAQRQAAGALYAGPAYAAPSPSAPVIFSAPNPGAGLYPRSAAAPAASATWLGLPPLAWAGIGGGVLLMVLMLRRRK